MKTDSKTLLNGTVPLIDPELLSEIISTAADISLLVAGDGSIASVLVNPHHRSFGMLSHWLGRPVSEVLSPESAEKLKRRLASMAASSATKAVELNHVDDTLWEFPIRYSLHKLGTDNSILMLGRDLRPIAEMQQQLVMAQLALERDYESQREMDTRYRVLMEATRDAVMLVGTNSGRITDLNTAAAVMLGGARQDLLGAPIAQEFEGRRRGEFLESLTNVAAAGSVSPVELQARRSQRRLNLVPTLFRAAGERLLLCRIEAASDANSTPDAVGENMLRLFHEGVDGIVFLDSEGHIEAANDSFLRLVDSPGLGSVRGKSLAEFLARGSVDLRVMVENARRSGQLRMFATKLSTQFDGQVNVEISTTFLGDRPKPGFVMVIRDAGRPESLRRGVSQSDDGMRGVMELVGSSTLKDIVGETTDVVEKMCIQTAVELTRNNRVAAAEMLGLSRQSLYVKLRKFGLLSKDEA